MVACSSICSPTREYELPKLENQIHMANIYVLVDVLDGIIVLWCMFDKNGLEFYSPLITYSC